MSNSHNYFQIKEQKVKEIGDALIGLTVYQARDILNSVRPYIEDCLIIGSQLSQNLQEDLHKQTLQ